MSGGRKRFLEADWAPTADSSSCRQKKFSGVLFLAVFVHVSVPCPDPDLFVRLLAFVCPPFGVLAVHHGSRFGGCLAILWFLCLGERSNR